MSTGRKGIDDYRTVLDPGRMRRRLLTRAAIAGGVMILMLAGLMLFGGDDDSGTGTPAPVTAAGTSTMLTLPPVATLRPAAPAPEAPVEAEATVTVSPGDVAAQHAADAVAPLVSHEPEPQPIADDIVSPEEDAAAAEPIAAGQIQAPEALRAPPAPQERVSQTATASNATRQIRPAAAPSVATGSIAGDGFSAHLGEYGTLENAERLRAALAAQGLPAALVRRVVLGPVATRKAAEQMAAKLQQERKVAGFIVPDTGGKGFLVQTGVFAERANAEAQQRRLSTSTRKASIQARVVLGPYPSREEAEAVLAKVRGERKIAGTIVAASR